MRNGCTSYNTSKPVLKYPGLVVARRQKSSFRLVVGVCPISTAKKEEEGKDERCRAVNFPIKINSDLSQFSLVLSQFSLVIPV